MEQSNTSFCIVKETKQKANLLTVKNTCIWCDWQRLNFQNIQTAHVTK